MTKPTHSSIHAEQRDRRVSALATLLLAYHDDAGVTTSLDAAATTAIATYIDSCVERDALCGDDEDSWCDGARVKFSDAEADETLGEYADAANDLVSALTRFLNVVFKM